MAIKRGPAAGVLLRLQLRPLLVAAVLCSWPPMITCASSSSSVPPVRAVNLGGWLVVEGWIKPSPFDAIPNDELLDGTKIWIKSANKHTYLSAEGGGGGLIVANRSAASSWETFKIWRRPGPDSKFRLRAYHDQFVGLGNGPTTVVATETDPNRANEFEIVRHERNRSTSRIRIRAPNGSFLQATAEAVTADYGSESTSWDDTDLSVFIMEIREQMTGEFQLCNFYGLDTAGSVLKEHWNRFIVEDDFRFISSQGLNAVRIPVAWWITMEQGSSGATGNSCHSPFYPGYKEMLDKAFDWADTYNLSVIVDLHAAPGSQNGYEHSGSRDGSLRWPNSEANNIQRTVDAIRALADRYGSRGSLLAMELLNEPGANVPLEKLKTYYSDGYSAVREHSSNAYVIMSARLSPNPPEILEFMAGGGFNKCVVDVHYYNLYDDSKFGNMTLEQNINYVRTNRTRQLRDMQRPDGPLVFVGEWAAEWSAKSNPSDADYGEFARAQLEVFGGASFGWAYWTYRNDLENGDPGWSLKQMIQRRIVSFA